MIKWMMNRIADILLALLVMTALLWYVLTQPILAFGQGEVNPAFKLDRQVLEASLRELVAIPASTVDPQVRFNATSDYLNKQLSVAGTVESADRGQGQRILRLRVGKDATRRLYLTLHYVVTDKPLLEVAETAISLIQVAKALAKDKSVGTQLSLTIILHHADQLAQSLLEVSASQVEQLVQAEAEGSDVLIFMPGLRLPEAAYVSDQWRYFKILMPSDSRDLSLFGRMEDIGRVRELKQVLRQSGLGSGSLNIPTSFPDMPASALKLYWDRGLSAILVKPNILTSDKDFYGHIKFISALHDFLKSPPK